MEQNANVSLAELDEIKLEENLSLNIKDKNNLGLF